MTMVIIIGFVLTVGIYFTLTHVGDKLISKYYLSDESVEARINQEYDSLNNYIKKNSVKGTDTVALNNWMKGRKYVYLSLYDEKETVFESGWWDMEIETQSIEAEELEDSEETQKKTDTKADTDNEEESDSQYYYGDYDMSIGFEEDVKNRIVEFSDGEYYAFIDNYSEVKWYDLIATIIMVICFLVLLITILLYNRFITKRVIKLATEVKAIRDGNLDKVININNNDEITTLADGVDQMRKSIIEKLQNEQEAWEANCQLITAMSHDIRTPLTSLIGYLDIIYGEKYKSEEDLIKYIESCRAKAFQLKDLSDKLFQYFLVFGKPETDINIEAYDGNFLFEQILGEHIVELKSNGFLVESKLDLEECIINTEITHLRRVFDNIFSNLIKYAEKSEPISIIAVTSDNKISIRFLNKIKKEENKVESTCIGIKTCERICIHLGGKFNCEINEDIYKTYIEFPIIKNQIERKDNEQI